MYIARPGVGKEMVNKCMAAGCSNTPSDRVSLLKLPSDGVLRCTLEKELKQTKVLWKATKHSFLCSDHFTEDCFEGGELPRWSGMEEREVVFLVPAARWWPAAGRSRMGW